MKAPTILGCALAVVAPACAPAREAPTRIESSPRGYQSLAIPLNAPPAFDIAQADYSGAGTAGAARRVLDDYRAPSLSDLEIADSAAPRLVAVTGRASVLVDSVNRASDRLRDLGTRLGGYVSGSSFDAGGAGANHTAQLEIKVPAARFELLLNGVQALGRLESLESQNVDEGAEYVDVAARLRNARRLEQRLIMMIATRTGKVSDLLAAERALAATREDIERYEARVRYIRAETVYSTLTVMLHDLPRITAPASEASFLMAALSQSWKNFLFLVAFLLQVAGVVVPLAVLALIGWGVRARLGSAVDRTPFALNLRRLRG